MSHTEWIWAGEESGVLNCTLPTFTGCRYSRSILQFLELWSEGLRRMEISLVLGNKELWSYSYQASESGVGLCWWGWVFKVSLDSGTLSNPASPEFSASDWEQGLTLGVRVQGVCVVCLGQGRHTQRGIHWARCGL